ncbi:MAG TPA: hypothetical protein VFJ64_04795 [Solirubrobacterales bacterium]|nr:hypothetical protein [Solirubrobacterales bacterium]
MKRLVEPVGSQNHLAYLMAVVALIACLLLAVTEHAKADQIYWVNQNVISYSQLDGTEGGYLPASVNAIHAGNGTAIDTANARIYISQEATNQIAWFSLDSTSAGVVNTTGATVNHPTNVAIDPATQTLYWSNAVSPGSIGFASVNESGGGTLAQPGSTAANVAEPTRLAIDTLHGRVYWWNESSKEFSWVTTNGQVGGNLTTPDMPISKPGMMGGIALEPYSTPEELYFVSNEGAPEAPTAGIFHIDPLLGGEPEKLAKTYTEKNALGPAGLAFDLADNRFYWANSDVDEEPLTAIGTATVFGNAGTKKVFPEAPVHSPRFAAILKEPVSIAEPQLSVVTGTTLSCSLGEWEGDHPGASVFAAPTSYSYQWRRSSTPIPGATGSTYTVTENGSYSCQVTAKNAAGDTVKTSQSTSYSSFASKAENVKNHRETKGGATGVSAKLVSGKPIKVKAGGTAVIKVNVINSGTATSASTKLCGMVGKQVRKYLKPGACVTVKPVAPGHTTLAKLTARALRRANGTYRLTVAVSGATKGSLFAKVRVAGRHRK